MKYIYEFIGTFLLVFAVVITINDSNSFGLWGPLLVGMVLAVIVSAGGDISKGHYNPAISLAIFVHKKLNFQELGLYWVTQFTAGSLAALTTLYFTGGWTSSPLELHFVSAFIAEFLFTFALCLVVLKVAAINATARKTYLGWAIVLIILSGAYTVGTLSSAAFNPAIALGFTISNLRHWTNIWLYLFANLLAGATAALFFNKVQIRKI